MAKLEFKQNQLTNLVLPNLQEGIKQIATASNYMSSAFIPNGFRYKNELEQLKSTLNSIKTNLQKNYNEVQVNIAKIVKQTDELEQIASSLSVIEISKRVNKF